MEGTGRSGLTSGRRENRGTSINKRRGHLPTTNEQYETAINQWQRINDELEMEKPMGLARRLMMAGK